MTLEAERTPTRRTLLAGGLGGLIALLGGALGRPEEATAADDPNAVKKGVNNNTSAITKITCSGQTAFIGRSASGGSNRAGVFGSAAGTGSRGVQGFGVFGVLGESPGAQGRGVHGLATSASGAPSGVSGQSKAPDGTGVLGKNTATSGEAYGMLGITDSGNGAGVRGEVNPDTGSGAGVSGISGSPSGFGVEGLNVAASGVAVGVFGKTNSTIGRGVRGLHAAATGVGAGVEGETSSSGGVGVFGHAEAASGGRGVLGSASHASAFGGQFSGTGGAVALDVAGPVRLDRAGVGSIPQTARTTAITTGFTISASAKVFCTLQSSAGDGIGIESVGHTSTQIDVTLTALATQACQVAWLVID